MISGFRATLAVDDAGTGAASGGASTAFDGVTMLELGELAAEMFDATELAQVISGSTPDPVNRKYPTGTIEQSPTAGMLKYTKANYQRLVSLMERACAGDRAYTFVLVTPDDLTNPGTPVKLTATVDGFVSKVGKLVFEKGAPVLIPFEVTFFKRATLS